MYDLGLRIEGLLLGGIPFRAVSSHPGKRKLSWEFPGKGFSLVGHR